VFAQTSVCINTDSFQVEVFRSEDLATAGPSSLSSSSSSGSGGGRNRSRQKTTRQEIIEEIVGEAGIMSFLKHPKILHLYGCTLTAQAIWIVTELCEVGSLRMLLDDKEVPLSTLERIQVI
jgi:serine/threonine protein kinase